MFEYKYIRELSEYFLEKFGKNLFDGIKILPFRISQSVRLMRLFTLAGFSVFSSLLIISVWHLVSLNENIRSNQEFARKTSLLIQSTVDRVDDLLILLETNFDVNKLEQAPIQEQLKSLNISCLGIVEDGLLKKIYGQVDPTYADNTWHDKRWKEIENNLELMAEEVPHSFNLGFERKFRTKEEVSAGQQFLGSIALSRAWLKENKLNAIIAFVPMSSISKHLRLDQEAYNSGDYDYLLDEEGDVLCHPRLHVITGTGIQGEQLKHASIESEVGFLPINTRDADWIAGSEILNRAFEGMIRGRFTSVVYKNLHGQSRLTSFNLIPLEQSGIKGKLIGVVTGKGLDRFGALIAPLLLDSPKSLNVALGIASSLYMTLIVAWLLLVNRIRALHRDTLAWSHNMTAKTAMDLELVPIPTKQQGQAYFQRSTSLLVTMHDSNGLGFEEIKKINAKLKSILLDAGWVLDNLSLSSLIAIECRPYSNQGEGPKLLKIIELIGKEEIQNMLEALELKHTGMCLSMRAIVSLSSASFSFSRTGRVEKAELNVSSSSLVEMIEIDKAIEQFKTGHQAKVSLFYQKSLVDQKKLKPLGKLNRYGKFELYEIKDALS